MKTKSGGVGNLGSGTRRAKRLECGVDLVGRHTRSVVDDFDPRALFVGGNVNDDLGAAVLLGVEEKIPEDVTDSNGVRFDVLVTAEN